MSFRILNFLRFFVTVHARGNRFYQERNGRNSQSNERTHSPNLTASLAVMSIDLPKKMRR